MAKSLSELIAEADAMIETHDVDTALALHGGGGAVFIDVREADELRADGTIPGAVHIPRGVLEMRTDPQSASYVAALSGDGPLVLFCGTGGRSALAGAALQRLGRSNVGHLAGGISAWREQGGPIEAFDD